MKWNNRYSGCATQNFFIIAINLSEILGGTYYVRYTRLLDIIGMNEHVTFVVGIHNKK